MIGQICGKVVVIGQKGKVVWNSQGLAKIALIVAAATLQNPGGTEKRLLEDLYRR